MNDEERATIARLVDEVLPTLMERLSKSALGELEVRENGWRIRLRRSVANDAASTAQPSRQAHPVMAPGGAGAGSQSGPRDASRGLVSSPAVGYFAPRSGVEVGARVRSGDLVGYIDVLGVRQDVVSPVDGSVREFEVQSGQAVEYGQPIARVEADV
jgi:acetyl-CoA carboxylase biotin carboxyl carrier protein